MTDLEEAILVHRESLSLCPTPSHCPILLDGLGTGLVDRFGITGSMTDLEEAILIHRESLSLTPHPERFFPLNNLANAFLILSHFITLLQKRFGKTGSMSDLDEAILLYRESLSFRPTPHPSRFESLNRLACALYDRFGKTGLITDLEEAIPMLREALSLDPDANHRERPDVLNNLALSLEARIKKSDSQSDFETAASLRREILAMSE